MSTITKKLKTKTDQRELTADQMTEKNKLETQKMEQWKLPNQNSKKNKHFFFFNMKESIRESEDNINDLILALWEYHKEKRIKGIGNLFEEIMAKKHSLIWKRKDNQVQNAERVPNKVNSKRSTCRCIIIKITQPKDKEIILKAAREKQLITYK